METSIDQDYEEAMAELDKRIRSEQFGQLLTRSISVIGIFSTFIVLGLSLFRSAPGWIEKLVSFF